MGEEYKSFPKERVLEWTPLCQCFCHIKCIIWCVCASNNLNQLHDRRRIHKMHANHLWKKRSMTSVLILRNGIDESRMYQYIYEIHVHFEDNKLSKTIILIHWVTLFIKFISIYLYMCANLNLETKYETHHHFTSVAR